jgi:hypothetical protein
MRNILLVITLLLSVGLLLASAYSQGNGPYLDNTAFENPRRSAVPFDHDPHNDAADLYDCADCHHHFDEFGNKLEESSEDYACADCHELTDVGRKPGLMKAFHLNCKECHLSSRKGPITCGQCHPK